MNKDSKTFDENSFLNNNKILLEIITDLNQLINNSKEDIILKIINTSITKLNYVINETNKNISTIKQQYSIFNQTIQGLREKNKNNNQIINQEIKFDYGKYTGQVENGVANGKGVFDYNSGSKFEGNWKNGKKEGKGLYFYNNEGYKGDKYDGDWEEDKQDGIGKYFFDDGDMYEGNWKKGKQEGKGIYNYSNGDRYEGDFKN